MIRILDGSVAQLDRVVAFEAIGCRFESCQARQSDQRVLRTQLLQIIIDINLWPLYACAAAFGQKKAKTSFWPYHDSAICFKIEPRTDTDIHG